MDSATQTKEIKKMCMITKMDVSGLFDNKTVVVGNISDVMGDFNLTGNITVHNHGGWDAEAVHDNGDVFDLSIQWDGKTNFVLAKWRG